MAGNESAAEVELGLGRRVAQFRYDVCLSFAGEDREYVRDVAEILTQRGVHVFYDEYEEERLWGKDLFQHLDFVYNKSARFCVVFISDNYAKKLWTNHEIKSAQARSFRDNSEYILPARFDATEIPGIRSTTGYLDLRSRSPEECASAIVAKLAPYRLLEFHERSQYFPPNPDILYRALGIRSKKRKSLCWAVAHSFFDALRRLSDQERRVVLTVFLRSCPHSLPMNVHVHIDLLRRLVGLQRNRVIRLLSNIDSLGFEVEFGDADGQPADPPEYTIIRWVRRLVALTEGDEDEYFDMEVALTALEVISMHYCGDHAIEPLMRLNFSALSTATALDQLSDRRAR